MVTILALAALGGLLPMLAVAAWNLMAAPRLHRYPASRSGTSVSVLVPARDEAENLRRLIPALLTSHHRPLEIVVLDDGSSDETLALARDFARLTHQVRAVRGDDLPEGWTGKNWACHQLSLRASGDVLLFCDADVHPGPEAIGRSVAVLERHGAGAVTAFPRHRSGGWLVDAVVPLVAKLPVAALLPLPLVWRSPSPAVAAGNGQWFAWRRSAYDAVGGHQAVRGEVLEDVQLARRVKAAGIGLVALVATRDLAVRMYRSAAEVRQGFSKNLYPLLGGRPWSLGVGVLLFTLTMAVPVALSAFAGIPALLATSGASTSGSAAQFALASPTPALALAPLAVLLAVRGAALVLFRERPAMALLHPVGAVVVPLIALESWWRHATARVAWKGRMVHAREVA